MRSYTDAQVKELHASAIAARLTGVRLFKWNAGDTGAENIVTVDLSKTGVWESIDSEYCIRFGAKRTVRRSSVTRFLE